MKIFDLNEKQKLDMTLSKNHLSNLFNVYETEKHGYVFNINRTLSVLNTDKLLPMYYDEYTIQDGDDWALISYQFYDTTDLWWLVCKANNIINPLDIPVPGTKIKVLSSNIKNIILNDIKRS